MEETQPDSTLDAEISKRRPGFEGWLYGHSPFGFYGTTLAVFVFNFGSFVLIALNAGRPDLLALSDNGSGFNETGWSGFVLSLVLAVAIALNENRHRMWIHHAGALFEALPENAHPTAKALIAGIPKSWSGIYQAFFLIGIAFGLFFNVLIMQSNDTGLSHYLQSIGLWFMIFAPPLYGLGFRAAVDVYRSSRQTKALIKTFLEIDLFRLEKYHVFGRIGLFGALSWLIMAAVLLLFIVDPAQVWVALISLALSATGGITILVGAIRPVHDKIRAAKDAELVRVHAEMSKARARALDGDAAAASALAGLTDYETWVEKRPEWPLSNSVTTRMSLYFLIPLIPIIASYVFEKTADILLSGA
jgi:hypothetical protein